MNAMQRLSKLPPRQLIGLTVAGAAAIAMIVATWLWLQTPDYRALYANLGERDGGAVVAALNQMNVPYKFSDGGGAILVPSNLLYDTRLKLASQGLPKGSTVGYELLEQQKFGTTQFQEQVNFQRGLEGELAKSIQSVSAVQTARVHLAIPKPSVFLREQQKPSASVLVTLHPGKALDRAQVSGIVHLVSSSVPELVEANVAIVDASGNLLTKSGDANGLDPGKLAYVHDIEQNTVRRITAILEPIVGAGNVRAEVSADVDFSQTEQTAETFKPNGSAAAPANGTDGAGGIAMRSQQSSESLNSNGSAAPGGVPGAQSNQPQSATPAAAPAAATNSATKKDTTTNYELDRTVEVKRLPVGTIKRLSTAIVVNHRKLVDAKPDSKGADAKQPASAAPQKYEPLSKPEIDQITALAREAIGFNATRGDSLNVVNVSFSQPEAVAAAETPVWKDAENVAMAKEIGKNALVGLVALYLVFGILRPAVKRLTVLTEVPAPSGTPGLESAAGAVAAPALGYPDHLQRARQLARDDPKAVANLVRNWVSANE